MVGKISEIIYGEILTKTSDFGKMLMKPLQKCMYQALGKSLKELPKKSLEIFLKKFCSKFLRFNLAEILENKSDQIDLIKRIS